MSGAAAPATAPALPRAEFVALMAMLAATVAFGIDSMLPALPEIAAELTPEAPNAAQLVLTTYVLGMGLGTLVAGPVADALGRRRTMLGGAVLYCTGAVVAGTSEGLEAMLAGRLLQGLGAAAPRVAMIAMVRDLHAGPAMARILSVVMAVFTLVPALAPLLGTAIIAGFGWRGVFASFVVFSILTMIWLFARQPETLPAAARRPIRRRELAAGLREVLSLRTVRLSIGVQVIAFGMLFATLVSVQPIFEALGRAQSFPFWFAGISLGGATGALANASLVGRFALPRIAASMLAANAVIAALMAALALSGAGGSVLFAGVLVFLTSVFFMTGLVIGNVNAIALAPLPHVAGLASSVITAAATVGAALLATPVGLAFDGTVLPLCAGVGLYALVGAVLARRL